MSVKLAEPNYILKDLVTVDDLRALPKDELRDKLSDMIDESYKAKEEQLTEPLMR